MSSGLSPRSSRTCVYCGRPLRRLSRACYLHADLLDADPSELGLELLAAGEIELELLDSASATGVRSPALHGRQPGARGETPGDARRDG